MTPTKRGRRQAIVFLVPLVALLGAGCSGDDDDDAEPAAQQATLEDAAKDYAQEVVTASSSWAAKVVQTFANDFLSAGQADGLGTFNAQEGITKKICGSMTTFVTAAGETAPEPETLEDTARAFAKKTLQVEAANELLRFALAKPAAERDQTLATLEVQGPPAAEGGEPPRGLDALTQGGWLDAGGQLKAPDPIYAVGDIDDAPSRKYQAWLGSSAKLLEVATGLGKDIDIDGCAAGG